MIITCRFTTILSETVGRHTLLYVGTNSGTVEKLVITPSNQLVLTTEFVVAVCSFFAVFYIEFYKFCLTVRHCGGLTFVFQLCNRYLPWFAWTCYSAQTYINRNETF